MAEKERPGVMLYFDLRPSLKRLSPEEKGLLFEYILDYAQFGVLPEPEGMVGIAWDFIRPRIDRDAERYEEISERRRQAAKKRWDRQEEELQADANAYFAMQTMPTTTTPSTTTTKTTSSPKTTPATASTPMPSSSPRMAGLPDPDRLAMAEELSFEEMRQRKLNMLSSMISSGS